VVSFYHPVPSEAFCVSIARAFFSYLFRVGRSSTRRVRSFPFCKVLLTPGVFLRHVALVFVLTRSFLSLLRFVIKFFALRDCPFPFGSGQESVQSFRVSSFSFRQRFLSGADVSLSPLDLADRMFSPSSFRRVAFTVDLASDKFSTARNVLSPAYLSAYIFLLDSFPVVPSCVPLPLLRPSGIGAPPP